MRCVDRIRHAMLLFQGRVFDGLLYLMSDAEVGCHSSRRNFDVSTQKFPELIGFLAAMPRIRQCQDDATAAEAKLWSARPAICVR